jgi:hypothetical protein
MKKIKKKLTVRAVAPAAPPAAKKPANHLAKPTCVYKKKTFNP